MPDHDPNDLFQSSQDGLTDSLVDHVDQRDERQQQFSDFYYFEPFDVAKRAERVLSLALDDGVDLHSPSFTSLYGIDPHPFQTGYFMSSQKLRVISGATQSGKSICARIEVLIMASGELPFCFRYDAGVDTGVKRLVTPENLKQMIHRFGRHDSSTGQLIDFNENCVMPETWNEWDCGNIIGAGKYPKVKLAPRGSQFWIGTYKQVRDSHWWRRMADPVTRTTPDHFIDRSRGNDGINCTDRIIYLTRNCEIRFLTYEMQEKRFEGEMVWMIALDEEPSSKDIFASALKHGKYISLVYTPLHGMTWSKDVLSSVAQGGAGAVYHCTQFDCPYQNQDDIIQERQTVDIYRRACRVWGVPTEPSGEPFFDRRKIYLWRQRFQRPFKWCRFMPTANYHGVRSRDDLGTTGLLDTPVQRLDIDTTDDHRATWRMYEERQAGVPYIMGVDPAEGAPTPEEAGDVCAAGIMRPPRPEESRPVIVATIRSTMETIPFARCCSYAMRYYNNALLASERRGTANASFGWELDDWPWWYMHTNMQESTQMTRERKGFDQTGNARDAIFSLIRDWLNSFDDNEYPGIPDDPLLGELGDAVIAKTVGGKIRCDHKKSGTLDSAVWFGILLYVFKFAPGQIRCNAYEEPVERRRPRAPVAVRIKCNLSALGYRYGNVAP